MCGGTYAVGCQSLLYYLRRGRVVFGCLSFLRSSLVSLAGVQIPVSVTENVFFFLVIGWGSLSLQCESLGCNGRSVGGFCVDV